MAAVPIFQDLILFLILFAVFFVLIYAILEFRERSGKRGQQTLPVNSLSIGSQTGGKFCYKCGANMPLIAEYCAECGARKLGAANA